MRKLRLRDVGKGREHACIDAGSRATQGAVAEERKLWSNITNSLARWGLSVFGQPLACYLLTTLFSYASH